jgi:hypothetical protein
MSRTQGIERSEIDDLMILQTALEKKGPGSVMSVWMTCCVAESVGENRTQTFILRFGADDLKKKRLSPVVSLQCQTLFVFVRSKDKNSLAEGRIRERNNTASDTFCS